MWHHLANFSRFSTFNNMVLNMCSILVYKLWMPRIWHAKKVKFGNLDLSLFNHVISNLQSLRFTSKWRKNVSSFFNTPYKISSFEVIIPKMGSSLTWFVNLRGVIIVGFKSQNATTINAISPIPIYPQIKQCNYYNAT